MLCPPCPQDTEQLGLFGSQNPTEAGREVGLRAAAPVAASTTHLPSLEKPNPISPGGSSSPVPAAPPCSGQPTLEGGKVLQHRSSISLFPHPTLPASWSCSELPVCNWEQILPLVCSQHSSRRAGQLLLGVLPNMIRGHSQILQERRKNRWNCSCVNSGSPGWNSTGNLWV